MQQTYDKNKLHHVEHHDIQYNFNQVREHYEHNGIISLKELISPADREDLLHEINTIQWDAEEDITKNWNNETICFYSKNPLKPEMDNREYVTEPYFQASGKTAHVFYEAIDGNRVVNRIGHGMHLREQYPMMQQLVYNNDMLLRVLKGIGLKKPVCHLSVYIPKHPNGAGSEVRPHQESTFAYTEPHSVVVLWLALEDALIENACMYGILGSNKWPLKWVSRVNHQEKSRVFEKINDCPIPDFVNEHNRYLPLEVRAGDALLFHGNFVHCSPVNTSAFSRKALSFQFIETEGTHYPDTNWLQQPNVRHLY